MTETPNLANIIALVNNTAQTHPEQDVVFVYLEKLPEGGYRLVEHETRSVRQAAAWLALHGKGTTNP